MKTKSKRSLQGSILLLAMFLHGGCSNCSDGYQDPEASINSQVDLSSDIQVDSKRDFGFRKFTLQSISLSQDGNIRAVGEIYFFISGEKVRWTDLPMKKGESKHFEISGSDLVTKRQFLEIFDASTSTLEKTIELGENESFLGWTQQASQDYAFKIQRLDQHGTVAQDLYERVSGEWVMTETGQLSYDSTLAMQSFDGKYEHQVREAESKWSGNMTVEVKEQRLRELVYEYVVDLKSNIGTIYQHSTLQIIGQGRTPVASCVD